MLDSGWAKVLTDWAQFVIAGGVGGVAAVWAVLSNRDSRRSKDLGDLGTRVAGHAERLTMMEQRAATAPTAAMYHQNIERLTRLESLRENAPSHIDLARLHGRIDAVTSGLAEVRGELKGISGLLGNIDRYLRRHQEGDE